MQTTTNRQVLHIPVGTGEAYNIIGELITFKVTNVQTGGAFTVMELLAQPGGGPPLHTHPSAESFIILEGSFEFTGLDGGQPSTFTAMPGDTVFVPSGEPHTYKAVGEIAGKALLVFTPGTEMEQFFSEAGQPEIPGHPHTPEPPNIPAMIAIAQKHGLEFLGIGP